MVLPQNTFYQVKLITDHRPFNIKWRTIPEKPVIFISPDSGYLPAGIFPGKTPGKCRYQYNE